MIWPVKSNIPIANFGGAGAEPSIIMMQQITELLLEGGGALTREDGTSNILLEPGVDLARSFNGTSNLIDAGVLAGKPTNAANYPLSMSAWFNPTTLAFPNTTGTYAAICGRNGVSSTNCTYILYLKSTGKIGWYIGQANVDPGLATVTVNTWNHIAVTMSFTPVAWIGYLNGTQDATSSFAASAIPGVSNFQIGSDSQNLLSFNFPGAITDIAIWNTILTPTQITNLAAGQRANKIGANANLIHYEPILGQSPEPDVSGNGNNGVLSGTTVVPGPPQLNLYTGR